MSPDDKIVVVRVCKHLLKEIRSTPLTQEIINKEFTDSLNKCMTNLLVKYNIKKIDK